jgi:hypothetical protein
MIEAPLKGLVSFEAFSDHRPRSIRETKAETTVEEPNMEFGQLTTMLKN